MDKLTAIKIKYDDGTYSDEIPVSVLSENVEWDSTHTLVDVLGSIDVDVTGTIQDQISQLFNEKVGKGEMQTYVSTNMNTYITEWLNTNVDPVGSAVVVDKSLSIEGAAADAEIIGKQLKLFLTLESDNAIIIPQNSDLNNYITPGNYRITTISISETIQNIPYQTNGRLSVCRTTQSDRIIQIYQANSAIDIQLYYRFYNGQWSNWTHLPNSRTLTALKTSTLNLDSDSASRISNVDLNNYTTYGSYKVVTITDSTTIQNIPYQSSGRLFIFQTTQNDRLAQIYWVNSTSIMIYYRFYNGQWSHWEALPKQSDLNSLKTLISYTTERDCSPYSSNQVSFRIDQTTIYFTCARIMANYKTLTGTMQFKMYNSTSEYEVPHDSYAIYNIDSNIVEIRTYSDLRSFTGNYITMFYNSNGNPRGLWEKYYIKQNINELKSSIDYIPSYYNIHLTEKEQKINLLLAEQNSHGVIFITDHHYPSNQMHSPLLVKNICNTTGINTVFLGGDYINRETLKSNALLHINRVASLYEYPNIKTLRICGNHEGNNPGASTDETLVANQLSPEELRNSILNTSSEHIVYDNNSLSYYYDDNFSKIRYIVGAVNYKSQLELNSIEWIANQLLTIPQDYSVVILFHTILQYKNNVFSPVFTASNLINILDAVKTNTSYAFNGKTYDYTNKNIDLICAICGDMHIDGDYTTPQGVKIIATTTDSLQEDGGLVRTVGTILEQAFDIFIFNKNIKKIYCVRIGAGIDREFTY